MKSAQCSVMIAQFAYSGNGGYSAQLPSIGMWLAKNYHKMASDPRIEHVGVQVFSDTPITMTRNAAVKIAKAAGFDFLMMIDSDNELDMYLGRDPLAKPFWDSSFDFAYERLCRGLPTAIFAPYCGPPPHPVNGGEENVYVFDWETRESGEERPAFKVRDVSRNDAAVRAGIQPAAAGPTGCILYSVNAFDLMGEPKFKYEWQDETESHKDSTEDVYNTREIAMGGWLKHEAETVYCNWDAWAGHHKPKCVGRPLVIGLETISKTFREAVLDGVRTDERKVHADFTKNLPEGFLSKAKRFTDEDFTPSTNGHHKEEEPQTINGLPVMARMIAGRAVKTYGSMNNDNDLNQLTALTEVVAQSRRNKALRVIEVGSWVGESAIAIEAGFGPAGGTLFCVDHWEGSSTDTTGTYSDLAGKDVVYNLFCENIGDKLDRTIKPLRDFSTDLAAKLEPQEADLIFIDAGHTYEECKADIEAWLPHCAPDGIICGHDYGSLFAGVVRAVQEKFAGVNIMLPQGTTLWIVKLQDYLAREPATQPVS